MFEPLIREDIEAKQSTRRYIALRWTDGRRVSAKKKSSGEDSTTPPSEAQHQPPSLSQEGRVLAGYILGEFDVSNSLLHELIPC